MGIRSWLDVSTQFLKSQRGVRLVKFGNGVIIGAVVILLAIQLTEVGWGNIVRALPADPRFYAILLIVFFLLPLCENLIYQRSWHYPFMSGIGAFIKKRVFNKDVLGYSGELYLYVWARKRLGLPDGQILRTIRDNNIVSSVASTIVAVGVLWLFLSAGQIPTTALLEHRNTILMVGGGVLLVILALVATKWRRYVFAMPAKLAGFAFSVHIIRLLVGNGLHVLQWHIILPDVPISVWITLVSVQIIVTRIPLLPSRDLIFLGIGVELSAAMDVSQAEVAGMILVSSAISKVLGFGLFTWLSTMEKDFDPATDSKEPPRLPDLAS